MLSGISQALRSIIGQATHYKNSLSAEYLRHIFFSMNPDVTESEIEDSGKKKTGVPPNRVRRFN